MNKFKVTFKRLAAFYQTIIVEASTSEEARAKANEISLNGAIEFDYRNESDLLDEYILEVDKIS
jgi:hypothetical protein